MNLDQPHRRFNPLTGEWVLVSPHRTKRPWLGHEDLPRESLLPQYDPDCYLCPGNVRASGEYNPEYSSTFVFTNDFSALLPETIETEGSEHPLLTFDAVAGTCRVICFSPRHDLTLREMQIDNIRKVIDVWVAQFEELSQRFRWVQVFENKGALMGCSNPHPHCQVWASDSLPNEPAKEDHTQLAYFEKNRMPMLMDYLEQELNAQERIVMENDSWVVLVPFWAIWPFETLLLPKRHVLDLAGLSETEKNGLAEIMKKFLTKYDRLFDTKFPFSMGWHGAPGGIRDGSHWQLHAHYYPPLLRSASVKKFIVGYELLAEVQRDITAETAAGILQNIHID